MKELDFDELDKAVNSLMSKTDVVSSEQSVPVTTSSPALQPVPAEQSPVTPISVSSNIAVTSVNSTPRQSIARPNQAVVIPPIKSLSPSGERTTPRPTVPAKRSGRFMDLVPSSSELQSPMKSPSPRQGTTLSPINENVVADTPAPVTPVEPVLPATPQVSVSTPRKDFSQSIPPSVSPLAASMSMNTRTKHDDMPDPLDMHQQQTEETSKDSSVFGLETTGVQNRVAGQPTEPVEIPAQSAVSEPIVSPFLTDAKVDKRPLGNASTSSVTPQSSGIPAELNTDLLEVESDHPANVQAKSTSPVSVQQSAELTPPISIAQQYKQQPRSGDQSHAAVYDTAAHPVTHPGKKKSNLLLIVVIAAIILIGGGGVAVLFTLGYI